METNVRNSMMPLGYCKPQDFLQEFPGLHNNETGGPYGLSKNLQIQFIVLNNDGRLHRSNHLSSTSYQHPKIPVNKQIDEITNPPEKLPIRL